MVRATACIGFAALLLRSHLPVRMHVFVMNILWTAILVVYSLFSSIAHAGPLLTTDFSDAGDWPEAGVVVQQVPADALQRANSGTVDEAGTTKRSPALVFSVTQSSQTARFQSGRLPVHNEVSHLGQLTLSFDYSMTPHRPFIVHFSSLDANGNVTGTLKKVIYPAASEFFQHISFELSEMTSAGDGSFSPTSGLVQLEIEVPGGSSLVFDNFCYAAPSYFVSPSGSDNADGRSEATAFASPQKAVDVAQPGDVILLMNGTYLPPAGAPSGKPLISMGRSGRPDSWILLKNYPGHQPIVSAKGQQAVQIETPFSADETSLGYLEVRGLAIRGNGDTAREEFASEIGKFTPNVNSYGIYVFGQKTLVHHVRIANNTIEYCTADGLYIDSVDYMYVEGNHVRNNCWTTVNFAPAGLTVMKHANFDTVDNVYKFLVAGNQVNGNRLEVFNKP